MPPLWKVTRTPTGKQGLMTLANQPDLPLRQIPDRCQVVVVMLGNKVQMIDETHGLLKARMDERARKL
jgi:hypothetical protein